MKMEHISIHTADLEKFLRFYTEALGLRIQTDFRGERGMPIVFVSDGAGSPPIELIEGNGTPYTGAGLSIGFHVEDIERAHRELEDKGCHPTPFVSPVPGVRFFFIKDPNGVDIQLM